MIARAASTIPRSSYESSYGVIVRGTICTGLYSLWAKRCALRLLSHKQAGCLLTEV